MAFYFPMNERASFIQQNTKDFFIIETNLLKTSFLEKINWKLQQKNVHEMK